MSRIQRRRRTRCKLRCEVVLAGKRRQQARVVSLSEGGLALVADLRLEQGEPIRLLVSPGEGQPTIRVSGIVWNDQPFNGASGNSRLRRIGCIVSDPPRSLLSLLDRLMPSASTSTSEAVPIPVARPIAPQLDRPEPDLPRSRELQPPLKPEPEESLPYFRVRMKQIGGPRTRILTLRARSATQAEELAHDELARVVSDSEGWGILHIARVSRR
mgnify:CR=1 FL=1